MSMGIPYAVRFLDRDGAARHRIVALQGMSAARTPVGSIKANHLPPEAIGR
jgi:hypothetical protein